MRRILFSLVFTTCFFFSFAQDSKLNDTLLLDPIEIKSTRASEASPFTKTTINKTDIQSKNLGQDLPFILTEVPGVVVNSDAGNGVGYTGIRIRGTDASRINVTLNGIPFNDAESQGTFFVDLPDFSSSVNSIQVQRGVGTSSNGAGSFGATVNLGTNELREKFYASLQSSAGSFNTWKHTFMLGSGLIGKHLSFDGRFSMINSDGYIDRAFSKLKSLYTTAAYITESNSFRINFFTGKAITYQAWYGVAEHMLDSNRRYNPAGMEQPLKPYENETDNYLQSHLQGFYNQKINKEWNWQSAFFYTKGKGYYEQFKAQASIADYGYQDPSGLISSTNLIRRLQLNNDFYGTVLSLQYRKTGNEFTLGGGWNRYDGKHFGTVEYAEEVIPAHHRWYDVNADKTDLNVYGKLLQKINPALSVFIDLQLRNVNYDLFGFRDNPGLIINNKYSFFNPKAGISYSKNAFKVYASYALANKEPNRDDFEAGASQQPLPERLHDLEAGIEKRSSKFYYSLTGYLMNYDNQLVLTGKVNDVGAYTRTNIKESYRAGIELEGKASISKWFSIYSNLCLSRNKVKNFTEYADDYDNGGQVTFQYDESDISFSPGITAVMKLIFEPVKNGSINLTGRYTGKQYLDNTSNDSRSLQPFFVQDLQLNYSLPGKLFNETGFTFQLNNIWDKKYEPNGYTYSYIYGAKLVTENFYFPMAGRNFMIAVKLGI